MLETVDFRPGMKQDIPQFVSLMNSQYSRKKGETYFLWQYFNSYYPAVLMCATANDKIIGMFGLQKKKLNNRANVGQALDILVAPEWRGKGIFKELGGKAIHYFQDVDLLCVFANLGGKKASEKSLGWKTLDKINSMWIHPEDIKNVSGSTLESVPKLEKTFCRFEYSPEIRNWRYNQHPDYKYYTISQTSGEFAVTKIFTDPDTSQSFGDIVDFECDLNDKVILKELFLRASLHLRERGVVAVTTWALPHTPLREVLESIGFTELQKERYFCVKVLNPQYEYLSNISSWHLVEADAEIY